MSNQRIAVIGGVAAGPAAAAQAQRVDPDADVVLFEQGDHISYGACEMPYYVADWIEETDRLVVLTPERFEETRGATVCTQHQVLAIHPRRCRLDVKNLKTGAITEERFDKFILAVGAHARMPEVAGVDAPNVMPVRRLEDAIRIKSFLETNDVRHATVLGGGYIGVEMAEALRARGVRATILEPGPGVLHGYVDADLREIVQAEVKKHGVLIRQERAEGFEQDSEGRVRAVLTEKGEKIGCQLVLVAMGITPNTDVAEAAGVKIGTTGALAVDDHMRTNLPNVWACGDCVEVTRVIDQHKIYLPLSPVAFRSGHVAAENAARRGHGAPARFPGVCPASAVKVFGLEVAAVGLRLADAQEAGFEAFVQATKHWSRSSMYPGAERLHVRYVVEQRSGRLLGAQLVGKEGAAHRANVLVPLIREGWTVDQIKDLDLIYTPPVAPSLDPLIVTAARAERRAGWQ